MTLESDGARSYPKTGSHPGSSPRTSFSGSRAVSVEQDVERDLFFRTFGGQRLAVGTDARIVILGLPADRRRANRAHQPRSLGLPRRLLALRRRGRNGRG